MPARAPHSPSREQSVCAGRQGTISRPMLFVIVCAAVGTSAALVWFASQFTRITPDQNMPANVSAGTRVTDATDSPAGAPVAESRPEAAAVSARSAGQETAAEEQMQEPVRLSAAERERIRQLTRMFEEAQSVSADPAGPAGFAGNGEIVHRPNRNGFFDEEQRADLRAEGRDFREPADPEADRFRKDPEAARPSAGPPSSTPGTGRPTSLPPRKKKAGGQVTGQKTLDLWNRLNGIIEEEATMRAAPSGGVTAGNADDFLGRRAAASRYAAEAIADLKTEGVDREVIQLAASLSKWYAAGIDVAESARRLLKASPEVRRGPQGKAWRAQEEQHNATVAELNRQGAEVRESMQQRYRLEFPPLK